MGVMALPPRGSSSGQQLWEGHPQLKGQSRKGLQGNPRLRGLELLALSAWCLVGGLAQVAVFPTSVLQSHGGAAACPADGWTWEFTLCVLGAGTAGKAWAMQHRVFKGLSKKGPHLNVSGWATNMPSYFRPHTTGHMADSHTIEAEDHEGWTGQ